MIGGSGHIRLAGDGLLEIAEERLKEIIRTEAITDVYHVEQTPFARGKFASVRKLVHKETGTQFAGKFIRRRRRALDSGKDIAHEVAVLELCSASGRIVKLHEVYETRAEVALVLELATGGELQRFLDTDERLCERDARNALLHTLQGLQHLHKHNIAHLDLKPQNLLVWSNTSETDSDTGSSLGEVKLCDFGISRLIQPGVEVREILGTPDYVAPEVLQYEPLSLATDIWSVGVLTYVLLSGFSPFAGDTKQETFLNISQAELTFPPELFENVSSGALDFIRECLVLKPGSRLTVDQCLEHPWIRDCEPYCILRKCQSFENLNKETVDAHRCNGPSKSGSDTEDSNPGTNTTELNKTNIDIDDIKKTNHDHTTEDTTTELAIIGFCRFENDFESYILPKKMHSLSPQFPDAPTTPKVSRKSHPISPNSVLTLCKKFQPDVEIIKPTPLSLCRLKNDVDVKSITDTSQSGTESDDAVSYSVTITCTQCDSQCCHIIRPKTLGIDQGIVC